jgi:hypothetical protein
MTLSQTASAKLHFGALLLAISLTLSGHAAPQWRGYCLLPEGPLFSLSEPTTGDSRWVKLGDEYLGFVVVSGTAEKLTLRHQTTGQTTELTLVAAHVKDGTKLPPLSKQQALAFVRAFLTEFDPEKETFEKKSDTLPVGREPKSKSQAKADAAVSEIIGLLNANAAAKSPESPTEVLRVHSELRGDIELPSRPEPDGSTPLRFASRLTPESLPPHVRANLTQEDLDTTLDLQRAMMIRVHEAFDRMRNRERAAADKAPKP